MSHMFGIASPTVNPWSMSASLLRALFDSSRQSWNPNMSCLQVWFWRLAIGWSISPKVIRINILTKYAFFSELQNSLANEYQDVYIRRQQDEDSGIYEPYEPLWFLNLAMVILMTLIQYGIIIMLYFIQITTGDRRDDGIIYEGLVPMIRVLTIIAMAILGLAGYFRWW